MYNYSDYVYDTGYAKGKAAGKKAGILIAYAKCMRSLMEKRHMLFDDAANELGIPDADRPALRKELGL